MISQAVRSLKRRPLGTVLTAVALFTVAATAGLVTTFAQTTQADFIGDARQAWQTPYDLLVRPAASQTELELAEGLVRPNFMAGIHGGIDRGQLEAIRGVEGVDVAAPIAIVGFVNWPSLLRIPVPQDISAVYRFSVGSIGEEGMSTYPVDERLVVVSTDGTMVQTSSNFDFDLFSDLGKIECTGAVDCFAPNLCMRSLCAEPARNWPGYVVDEAEYSLFVMQPLLVAGIDPDAEAKIAGLDMCMTSGRYLQNGDRPMDLGSGNDLERIPIVASNRSFVNETLTVTMSRSDNQAVLFQGVDPAATTWIAQNVESHSIDELYQQFLLESRFEGQVADPYPIWTAGDVTYDQLGDKLLRPVERETDLDIYRQLQGGVGMEGPDALIPAAARDRVFRDVETHGDGYRLGPDSKYRLKNFVTVGTYDPGCIPGWDPLAGGKLDAYSYPSVKLRDGRMLGPTRAVAGYVNSPPLLLTTLEAADWLSDPQRFRGQPGAQDISVVRVRVTGVDAPSEQAEARLRQVALAIEEIGGLQVDLVKGSSLTSVAIQLPPGNFGRPAELASEAWSKKGVVIQLVRGVEAQSIALLVLAFGIAAAFVGTVAFASTRRRRREFAILRALGWPRSRLAVLVELEVLIAGLFVAVAVDMAGIVAGRYLSPMVTPNFVTQGLVVIGVSAVAGLLPAIWIYRGTPLNSLQGGHRNRQASAPDSIRDLATREMFVQSPIESSLAVAMLAIGVLAVGFTTMIAVSFGGALDFTILGRHVAAKSEPHQFLVAGLVLVLAAIENAQLLMLTSIERSERLVVLGAIGWPRSALLRLVAWHGVQLACIGATCGALLTIAVGAAVTSSWLPLITSAAAGALAGFVATMASQAAVVWHVGSVLAAQVRQR